MILPLLGPRGKESLAKLSEEMELWRGAACLVTLRAQLACDAEDHQLGACTI